MARGRVETFTGYFPALRYVKITCSLLRRKSGILPKKAEGCGFRHQSGFPSCSNYFSHRCCREGYTNLTGIHEFQTYKPHRLAHSRLADAVLSAVLSVTVAR